MMIWHECHGVSNHWHWAVCWTSCSANNKQNTTAPHNWPLTHLPLVPHLCVSDSNQHWSRLWLVAYSAPSLYLNQCWVIVNWNLRNKLQWNLNLNTNLFIHKNVFRNVVCEMASILSRERWVNGRNPEMVDSLPRTNKVENVSTSWHHAWDWCQ